MTYSIHFAVDLEAVAEPARLQIEAVMEQIGEVIGSIAPSNAFWASMKDSLLQVDVAGYRVVYRVDPKLRELRVVELDKPLR